mgnify:FL=1
MIWFILAVLALIAAIVIAILRYQGASIAAFGAALLFGILSIIASVPAGHVGVVSTFGKVDENARDAGLYVKAPWSSVTQMSIQEQRYAFDTVAYSSDIQEAAVKGSVNYIIDKTAAVNLYRTVGVNYLEKLIAPRVVESLKDVFSHYRAEELISQRDSISKAICEKMNQELKTYGITIVGLQIEDIDYSDLFTSAIEAKQVATQEKLRAQTEQERVTMEKEAQLARDKAQAETDAEIKRINAQAEADRVKMLADAEAEANKKISESLTEDLIKYTQVSNWNGVMPTTVVNGNDITPLLSIGE